MRVSGILRGLGGFMAGSFTTTQRNAITAPPAGLVVLNTTTSRYEWNAGTSGAPSWQPLGSTVVSLVGVLADKPTASSIAAGSTYYATDQDVQYTTDGTSWYRTGGGQPGDLVVTFNTSASIGRVLCTGQAWPGTTGVYADLHSKWGGSNLPDLRGRMPVILGTHSDVDTLGKNEGVSVGNRRPKHNTTINDGGHGHAGSTTDAVKGGAADVGQDGLSRFNALDWVQGALVSIASAVTGITAGPGGTAPVDTPAYLVVNVEAKL